MYKIYKMRDDQVINFAAEELKKYLRMMMPECGDIVISCCNYATDGLRLGLLEDFSLPFEGEDAALDDVIHVDVPLPGGILAGSNGRSVLFAVYRFLRENGCRWLHPGTDGEIIPMQDIVPVQYHKMADHRFRGHCNEGSESQQCMLETIDFYPKQEINVYMLECRNPFGYYDRYYSHIHNEKNRPPEPVSHNQTLQWKRQCEVEIAKRGLMFHDIGHGWTAEPFGMGAEKRELFLNGTLQVPEDVKQYLAFRRGQRSLRINDPEYTNLCYSNPEVRHIMVQAVADYAENHQNIDYLHVWLADTDSNHCECEQCQKLHPTDYYVMMMNELDKELEKRNLDTRITFIAYVDTLFAPKQEKIENPTRFSLLYAPVSRSYTSSFTKDTVLEAPIPYVRNKWKKPETAAENTALLHAWKAAFDGPTFAYEYHFWRHQYLDLGGLTIARRIYEDIRGIQYQGLQGIIEDGSQRSFFPSGFPIEVYARTLMDRDADFEQIKEDYFFHAYGEDWKTAVDILEKIGDTFDFAFMEGEKSKDPDISVYYDPERAEAVENIQVLTNKLREFVKTHYNMPLHAQTVSVRLLGYYCDYVDGMGKVVGQLARGNWDAAKELAKEFLAEMGRNEIYIERYYDQGLVGQCMERLLRKPRRIEL